MRLPWNQSMIAFMAAALLGPALAQTPTDVQVRNTYSYLGKGRYKWTVFLNANNETLEKIRCVEYTLHPTYPKPVWKFCDQQAQNFRLTAEGWGEFMIHLKIEWKDGQSTHQQYWLDLHSPPPVPDRQPAARAAETAPIRTRNTSKLLGKGQWEWTVFIAADPSTFDQIQCVEYVLHPTFPNPIQRLCESEQRGRPERAFPFTAQGWGTFIVGIKVEFRNGRTRFLNHPLRFETEPSTQR